MKTKSLFLLVFILIYSRQTVFGATTGPPDVTDGVTTQSPEPETTSEPTSFTTELSALSTLANVGDNIPDTSAEPSTIEPSAEPTTSEPVPEPSTKAEPNTFSTAEPKPEAETTSEPEPEAEAEPETESIPLAEPGPDWEVAKHEWSFAWELHIYFYGLFFACIGIYCLISVIRLYTIDRLLSRKYFLTLNSLILGMCVIRSVYLLVDGYNSNGTYHPALDYLMYGLAFPCLTSAFSILMFALLQATRMQMISRKVQRFEVLVIIIVLHFLISITTDVIVGLLAGVRIMLFLCQLIFIIWGLFLFIGYAYIFKRVYGSAVKRQSMISFSDKSRDSVVGQSRSKPTLSLAVKITLGTAVFGVVTVALEIYGMVAVYGIFSDVKPEPWPWWTYHTVLRLTECVMCLTISYVASQPFCYKSTKTCTNFILCAPCLIAFSCNRTKRLTNEMRWSDVCSQSNTTTVSLSYINDKHTQGGNSKYTMDTGDNSPRPTSKTLLT